MDKNLKAIQIILSYAVETQSGICERCAKECEKHDDEHYRKYAESCRKYAITCRAMAA